MAQAGGVGNTGTSNFQPQSTNDRIGKTGRKATDRFQHRNVSALAGKPVVRAGLNRKAFKASPLNKRRVGALPQRKASPGLPRPGARQTQAQKKSMDEPAALKQMRRQNDARQKKLEQDLANLPSPPTHEPKGNSRSSGMMKADAKAIILPSSFRGLSDYIGKITKTKDLLETWNALTTKGIKGEISSLELSLLKDRCVSMLVKVSKDPEQADQISDVHLRKMIPDTFRRKVISSKVTMNKSGFVELQNRLNNLRKR
ncbi:hypothetical protein NX722_25715 [Endozoicomonas gorgoniicola]|uniref:Uncharacterized protein n=1 Tax=Endozoicomonas gorgoniicola TaxID=1234144 RepID=A0ABT3N2W1_9GAMM|nr:hypothetical protein [Endozoicomonas gorgoniicola]MCW7555965.1 hypothetical protein [Endozoicomonas gorgoniicola]